MISAANSALRSYSGSWALCSEMLRYVMRSVQWAISAYTHTHAVRCLLQCQWMHTNSVEDSKATHCVQWFYRSSPSECEFQTHDTCKALSRRWLALWCRSVCTPAPSLLAASSHNVFHVTLTSFHYQPVNLNHSLVSHYQFTTSLANWIYCTWRHVYFALRNTIK